VGLDDLMDSASDSDIIRQRWLSTPRLDIPTAHGASPASRRSPVNDAGQKLCPKLKLTRLPPPSAKPQARRIGPALVSAPTNTLPA